MAFEAITKDNGTVVGHVCECGKRVLWTPYVFAHLHVELVYTCEQCGCKTTLQNGVAEKV